MGLKKSTIERSVCPAERSISPLCPETMNKIELEYLDTNLRRLNFDPLDSLFNNVAFEEFEQILYGLAYDLDSGDGNLMIYTYMLRLLKHNKDDWRIHLSVSRLMGMILNHIDGCESIGLYHAIEADKLKPMDPNILEIILYYNHIPEKILTDKDAVIYTQKLIAVKPNSDIAKRGI